MGLLGTLGCQARMSAFTESLEGAADPPWTCRQRHSRVCRLPIDLRQSGLETVTARMTNVAPRRSFAWPSWTTAVTPTPADPKGPGEMWRVLDDFAGRLYRDVRTGCRRGR